MLNNTLKSANSQLMIDQKIILHHLAW